MNLNPDEVYQEMVKGILPGVKLVPLESGLWVGHKIITVHIFLQARFDELLIWH